MENGMQAIYMICEETHGGKSEILSKKDDGSVTVKAILQTADEWNRNKRTYGKKLLDDGLKRENVTELIRKKSWVGEAGHPHKPDLNRQSTVDPNNISHRILNYNWKGNHLEGIINSLNTDKGCNFKNVVLQELETAFSLRAVAPFEQTPQGSVVKAPLNIITYDWVILPSHRNAYQLEIIKSALTESFIDDMKKSENTLMSESVEICVNSDEVISFVKDSSKYIKLASEYAEFGYDNMMLSESLTSVILSKNDTKDTIQVSLENYISNEINSFFIKNRIGG